MPSKSDKPTYQELSQRLDEVMLKLQDPNVAVDEAADYYEKAMKLIAELEQYLEQAENRVREIKARFGAD